MSGKDLKFKLVLEADSKSFVTNVKQSESALKEALESIKSGTASFSLETDKATKASDAFGNQAKETAQQVDQLEQQINETNEELKETRSVADQARGGVEGLKTGYNALASALTALGIGASAKEIAATADEYKNLSGRLTVAIGDHGNLQKAMDDVKNVAIATSSNLIATGDLYARLTKIGQEMKWPQEQALALTKTINEAISVGGGSAASNGAAITQLNQALGSGVLRGDEFNSMMEQSPRLAQALADGLDVTTGKLREMAGEGKLTTEVVTKALLSQSKQITEEFNKFPATIGASIENLKTSWTIYIGEADAATGASNKVAGALKYVAENLDAIVSTLMLAGQAFIAYKALNIGLVFIEKANSVKAASVAVTQETTAVIANTQAQIANAAATRATATAKGQLATSTAAATASSSANLMGLVGRLGSLGIAITALGVVGAATVGILTPFGEWMGETAAKAMGYGEALEQLERQTANEAAQAKVAAEVKASFAAASEKARDNTYQLTEESKKLVQGFNELVEKGDPAKEALQKVFGELKFDSTQGINNAVTALILLKDQGKITGEDLKFQLGKALDGKDLIVFEANARAAFAGTSKEAEKTAELTEAVMKAALERTGLTTEQLQGKFSLAFQSASNDVQLIVNNLDLYKEKGIDTGVALAANLNKAIDTAQTRAELDYAKSSLIALEKQGLITGEQAALGLTKIEEKAKQLPAALNPVQAAFAALGIQTKDQLNDAAESAKRNFNVVSNSGQATADAIKQAYTVMLNAVAATGNKAEIAAVQAEAAAHGLRAEIDETGKTSVTSMNEVEKAVDRVGRSFGGLQGHARDAGKVMREEAKSSTQAWSDMLNAMSGSMHKTPTGSRAKMAYDESAIVEQLKAQNYDEKRAKQLAKEIYQSSVSANGSRYKNVSGSNSWSFSNGGGGMSNVDYVDQQIARYAQYAGNSTASLGANPSPTKNVNYQFKFGNEVVNLQGDARQEGLLNQLVSQLQAQAKTT